jgi:transketolase
MSGVKTRESANALYKAAEPHFEKWEVVKDLVDEMIDLMLNYRQSGHPGGSRSKVHALLSSMLSGAMRWDLREPWRPFCDRFVLSAGHTVPLIYATLSVLNESMRVRHERTGDDRFAFPDNGKYALMWEDLLMLRRNGGLSGHAEMEGKTLFLKWNTGPSGHGMPPAAGEAMALKRAGAGEVKVFALEGEGGLTPGASHETKNSAWGLGLDNLVFWVDWNDYGIDDNAISSVVHGGPTDWFEPYGWKVEGTEEGSEWAEVTRVVLETARGENPKNVPAMGWFKTRKGRGYLKYDNKSHGAAHPMNSEPFWTLRKTFMEKYGVKYQGVDEGAPTDRAGIEEQARANLEIAMSVLRERTDVCDYLSDRLLEVAASVPDKPEDFRLGEPGTGIYDDPELYDFESYPESMWAKPGEMQPNRAALGTWGSWVNTWAREKYGRPLFLAASADLAGSTNIAGFMKGYDGAEDWGWYERNKNPEGVLLPQQITEFTNAGICVGASSVNMAPDPRTAFDGFWTTCSTYASFSYLKYGTIRLFSQLAQDCDLKVGKFLWVAGHSGPETAEDSRTHFGIYGVGVTQLFPDGHVIDVHPWEYNEVPVVIAAALKSDAPIVALHLTRPKIKTPDRKALGMPSHYAAAKGAYLIRDYDPAKPKGGVVIVQGTASTMNLVEILPQLDKLERSVKIVAAISPQLFDLQDEAYRNSVLSGAEWWDAMTITNRSRRLMSDWIKHEIVSEYSMCSDWDNRWRTGGSLEEVIEEAHLSPKHLLEGIGRFVKDRPERLKRMSDGIASLAE